MPGLGYESGGSIRSLLLTRFGVAKAAKAISSVRWCLGRRLLSTKSVIKAWKRRGPIRDFEYIGSDNRELKELADLIRTRPVAVEPTAPSVTGGRIGNAVYNRPLRENAERKYDPWPWEGQAARPL